MDDKCPECGAASWLCHLLSQQDEEGGSRGSFVTPMDEATESKSSRNKIPTRRNHYPGRPKAQLPVDRILEMQQEGFDPREIAWALKQEGIKVSHMTIFRMLKGRRLGKDSWGLLGIAEDA